MGPTDLKNLYAPLLLGVSTLQRKCRAVSSILTDCRLASGLRFLSWFKNSRGIIRSGTGCPEVAGARPHKCGYSGTVISFWGHGAQLRKRHPGQARRRRQNSSGHPGASAWGGWTRWRRISFEFTLRRDIYIQPNHYPRKLCFAQVWYCEFPPKKSNYLLLRIGKGLNIPVDTPGSIHPIDVQSTDSCSNPKNRASKLSVKVTRVSMLEFTMYDFTPNKRREPGSAKSIWSPSIYSCASILWVNSHNLIGHM